MMTEKVYATPKGTIHYWVNTLPLLEGKTALVFLAGLTADHRLFAPQIKAFEERFPLLVWDAPAHGRSRPFALTFSMADMAAALHDILKKEGILRPVIVGQSMGGYVGQAFAECYPDELAGFVSIDSAPLQREYVTSAEIWLLRRTKPIYDAYPWKLLLDSGIRGTAATPQGQEIIAEIWKDYTKEEFCALTAYGYRILADAMDADLPYQFTCPVLLLCGEKDKAGSVKRYNRNWTKKTGFPLVWIGNAGHNANTDQPKQVNALLEQFLTEKVLTSNRKPKQF